MKLPDLPLLDPRTPAELQAELRRAPGWPQAQDDALRAALSEVFGLYAGLLTRGLNEAPQRALDAFLDLLPTPRAAAVPARTTLGFAPALRRAGPARPAQPCLPAGTQVAGATDAATGQPVVFETTSPLELAAARPLRAFAAAPLARGWSEATALLSATGQDGGLRSDARAADCLLHLALPQALLQPPPDSLHLVLEIEPGNAAAPAPGPLQWSRPTPDGPLPLQPASDGSCGLTRSGEIVFEGLGDWPQQALDGQLAHWLSCRFTPPAGDAPWQLPTLRGCRVFVRRRLAPRPLAAATCNGVALDLSREVLPLGERPRFSDTCLLQDPAFAWPGAQLSLELQLANPADGPATAPIPPVSKLHAPALHWECHTASGWRTLAHVRDGSAGLTRHGSVQFELPADCTPCTPARSGHSEAGWLRLRLARGDYTAELPPGAPAFMPPPHQPPALAAIQVSATMATPPCAPQAVLLEAQWQRRAVAPGTPLRLTRLADDTQEAALYLGLQGSPDELAAQALHFVLQSRPVDTLQPTTQPLSAWPAPRWQFRHGDGWADCDVQVQPGAEPGSLACVLRGCTGWTTWGGSTVDAGLAWLRLLWPQALPPLTRVLLNAVGAVQQLSLRDELLGSGNGRPGQAFTLAHVPVLGEPRLEVREPLPPDAPELLAWVGEQGSDALAHLPAQGRLAGQTWVRWQRVDDFSASGPLSRHYLLDAATGRVSFGDGRRGRMPPGGPNNIVMRRYRSGGGRAGNCAARGLQQLLTTTPYVESVSNPDPARGGQDAPSADTLRGASAAWLRHRDRAVGAADFEDLALLASPEVARVKCLAARDLRRDPLGRLDAPGCMSLVVLPRDSGHARPCPAPSLLAQVQSFLRERCSADLELVLAAPTWLPVDVDLEIVCTDPALQAGAAQACGDALRAWLHPVDGGREGRGWDFGRLPHVSDLVRVVRGIDGVVEVRRLRLLAAEGMEDVRAAGCFITCAGQVRCTQGSPA
ncbi:MAG: putative baseplate assembly protein [Aquabacterium sp.]|nr:MAG: putative baseplate assembly protein [Aquabacterium sp.]